MFTKFKDVSFITDHFAGTDISDSVLIIHTKNRTFEVYFNTVAEARSASVQLLKQVKSDLANQSNSENNTFNPEQLFGDKMKELGNVVNSVRDKITETLSEKVKPKEKTEFDIFTTLTKALTKSASDHIIEKNINKIVDELSSVLSKVLDNVQPKDKTEESKPTSCTPTEVTPEKTNTDNQDVVKKPISTGDMFTNISSTQSKVNLKRNDIFSATNTRSATDYTESVETPLPENCYVLIGDLTSSELKKTIDEMLDIVLASDKCKAMLESITKNFSKQEVESSKKAFKELVYNTCISNTESTVAQVLLNFFL